jgi:hypothetical protein
MKTFKVYFNNQGKQDIAFVDAPDESAVKWRLLGRFHYAIINKITELNPHKLTRKC